MLFKQNHLWSNAYLLCSAKHSWLNCSLISLEGFTAIFNFSVLVIRFCCVESMSVIYKSQGGVFLYGLFRLSWRSSPSVIHRQSDEHGTKNIDEQRKFENKITWWFTIQMVYSIRVSTFSWYCTGLDVVLIKWFSRDLCTDSFTVKNMWTEKK